VASNQLEIICLLYHEPFPTLCAELLQLHYFLPLYLFDMHFKILSAAPALTGIAFLLIYYAIIRVQRYLRLRHIPGPALASWSNIWLWQVLNSGRWQKVAFELDQKYGPVVRYAPDRVLFSQLEALHTIYGITNVMPKVLLHACAHSTSQTISNISRLSATTLWYP
jgi:hypothetical protein